MKKNLKRGLSGAASALMVGCSLSGIVGVGTTEAKAKLSSETLHFYVMGEQPKKIDMLYKALDKLTKKDLNCTVRFVFSTWTDWTNKYNLMLSSGQDVDICYSADWLSYPSFASKNAFKPLDSLLPKYAPTLWKQIPKSRWGQVKVEGKIYGVPNQNPEFVQHGFAYREDLRKKYHLPVINSIDTMEKYLQAVKDHGMETPLAEAQPLNELFLPTTKYQAVDTEQAKGIAINPNDLSKTVIYYELPEYLKMAKRMKTWADKGFWSKSVLSIKDTTPSLLENGKIAGWLSSMPGKAKGEAENQQIKGNKWEIGYFNYNDQNGLIYPAKAIQNVMCVPRASKNPERALMVLDKFATDRKYYDLTQYGIKGFSYDLTKDGKLDYTKIDSKNNSLDLSPWAWRNDSLSRDNNADWPQYAAIIKKIKSASKEDPMAGFIFDPQKVASEVAAVSAVQTEYAIPLETGLVDNVNKAYKTLITKLKDAGIDKIQAEVNKQLKVYVKKMK